MHSSKIKSAKSQSDFVQINGKKTIKNDDRSPSARPDAIFPPVFMRKPFTKNSQA